MATIYPANWRLPAGVKVVGGNLSGANLGPTEPGSATYFQVVSGLYANFPAYFSSYIQPSIDRAAMAGLNTVRYWCVAPWAVQLGVVPDNATMIGYLTQVARYAASKGLYVVMNGTIGDPTATGTIGPMTTTQFLAWITQLATAMAAEPNVILLDVVNEGMTQAAFNSGSSPVALQALQAARSAAPSLPITVSSAGGNSSSAMWSSSANKLWTGNMDAASFSVYYDWAAADLAPMITYAQGAGVPVFVTEYGGVVGTDNRTSRFLNADAVINTTGVAGACVWAIQDDQYGAWTNTGQEQADHAEGYLPLPANYGAVAADDFGSAAAFYGRPAPLPNLRRWYNSPAFAATTTSPAFTTLAGESGYWAYALQDGGGQSAMLLPGRPASGAHSVTFSAAVNPAGNGTSGSQNGCVALWDPVSFTGLQLIYFGYNAAGQNTWALTQYNAGNGTQLGRSAVMPLSAGTIYNVELRMAANATVSAYVNGTQVIAPVAHTLGYATGRAGLWLGGGNGNDPNGQIVLGEFALTCPNPVVAPVASCSTVGTTTASLSLAGGSGYTSIQWHRRKVAGSPPSAASAVAGATSSALSDAGLAGGGTYYYRAFVGDANGNTATTNEVAVTTAGSPAATPASTYSLVLPSAPVAGAESSIGVLFNQPLSVATTVTLGDANASFPAGASATVAAGSTFGTVDWTPTTSGSHAFIVSHAGQSGIGDPTTGLTVTVAEAPGSSGTYPPASTVLTTAGSYGPTGSPTSGTVVLPSASQVIAGVTFGPANSLIGTFVGSSGGGTSNVAVDSQGRVILAPNGLDAIDVEAGINARQSLATILAAAAGAIIGNGTGVVTCKSPGGVTRITATMSGVDRASTLLNLPS